MIVRFSTIIILVMHFSIAVAQTGIGNAVQVEKYQKCISLVEEDASSALTLARNWYIEGGGIASQHCEALALYNQDNFKEAATLFETIIDDLVTGKGTSDFAFDNKYLLRVQLNYLAGLAWSSTSELDKAYTAFSAAISGMNHKSIYAYDIFIERGLVQMLRKDPENAIDDFTRALEIDSEKVDAFLYRAEAYRKINQHLKARLDLNAGLSIEPNQPDLLFESGVNYRMQNNDEKALGEWEKLNEKYPNTHWQELIKKNIEIIVQ